MLLTSDIGIMINSNDHINNLKFTFPLKYFEYLAANLKIVAVNFDSHKNLPFAENINFFDFENKEQFIMSVLEAKDNNLTDSEILKYSYKNRVKRLVRFARLEGLEPPTL